MQENKTPVDELITDKQQADNFAELEQKFKEFVRNNPEQYEQMKIAAEQMAAAAAALMRQAAETARQFIAEFAANIQPSLDEIAEQLNEAWADMLKAREDAEIYPRKTLPRPDYGQTPKTTTKPYIKQITKSRSRERKQ